MDSKAKSLMSADLSPDLPVQSVQDAKQLENIKTHLDLILLALECLTGMGSEAMLQAAKTLNLENQITDRVNLWRLRQSNPLRKGSGGRKKLDIEEARSLVLIICYLAQQQQELIRRAVNLLENLTQQKQSLYSASLLADYLEGFAELYQARMVTLNPKEQSLEPLALKLLIDLLFYSSHHGHRRLWLALLEQSD